MNKRNTKPAADRECITCPHCNNVVPPILIWEDGSDLLVRSPKNRSANHDWRNIPGREFDYDKEANRIPKNQELALYFLLVKHFDGYRGFKQDGEFIVSQQLVLNITKAA